MRTCYAYLLTNYNHTVLYIGVTNDIARRVAEHKAGTHPGFTKKPKLRTTEHQPQRGGLSVAALLRIRFSSPGGAAFVHRMPPRRGFKRLVI